MSVLGHARLHAYTILLWVSAFIWMSLPYNNGLDMTIHKWTQLFNIALPEDAKPASDSILFIDVSASRYLVPLNEEGSENDVITNRKYLTALFEYIYQHKNNVRYIFTDVIFDVPTTDDSSLVAAIHKLGNKFLAVNSYTGDSLQPNILGVRAATATLSLQSGDVYKIPFIGKYHDTIVPFKIYTDLYPGEAVQHLFYTAFKNKGISFKSQIPEHALRAYDFTNGAYLKVGLGELAGLLKVSPELFKLYFQNRYILIGDFKNDLHKTYLNNQPGTLILFNAFWQLKTAAHILSIWYCLVLYLFLYWIVWLQWKRKSFTYNISLKPKYFQSFDVPFNIISISFLLILFTAFSSVIFKVNVSLFHLILIFSLIDLGTFLINKLEKKQERRRSKWAVSWRVLER